MKRKTISSVDDTNLPINPFLFEILQLVSSQRTNAKKVEILKKYEHDSIKTIFIWNFDESVISMLPPGDVPYYGSDYSQETTMSNKISEAVSKMGSLKSNSLGAADQRYSTIRREYEKFYNFVKGGNDSLNSIKRESIFINILEGLHPLEAEILCLCKDKNLQSKYKITKEIVSEAYPDITWGNRS